ncbi:putative integral membrane protein [Gloeocapsa sp. PCC 73106]|nr:putative integral membrane protein [Gloeocapsa sp. PCC 73106]
MDAIYPIVMTVLVLELGEPESGVEIQDYVNVIVPKIIDYILSFLLLFSFWYNQSRINNLFEQDHSRLTLWLNSIVLMLVTLLPFSIRLLHTEQYYGSTVLTIDYFNLKLTYEVFVDAFFIANWLIIDVMINLILYIIAKKHVYTMSGRKQLACIVRSRVTTTALFTLLFGLSIIINFLFELSSPRRVLFVFPVLLIFEDEIVNLLNREGFIMNIFFKQLRRIFRSGGR